MADATSAPDFSTLEDTYQIVGELHNGKTARRFVGKRVADGAPVMISVVAPPVTADNNELSHFAADVKLLSALRHPNILQVLDGRWLGDRYAVITERTSGTTLEDQLDKGAEFRNPRIAMVLQDVWSGLEAAREKGVVHRWVTPDSLYFEPNTKRVMVALSPTPIPITGVPGAAADARTIGTLAWAMLTGAPFDPSKTDTKLAEHEPNLATRVVDAVEEMVRYRDTDPAPDVPTALGIIAAGDVLKQGEIEIQAMKEEYDASHRAELEKCENHRMEVEQYASEQAALINDERATLDRLAAEQTAALAAEREAFDKLMAAREQRIVGLKQSLEAQAARAAKGLDVEGFAELAALENKPAPKPRARALVPAAIACVVIALGALGIFLYERGSHGQPSGGISVGRTTVVPSTPLDTGTLKRGGFLSQSAGGNVVPNRSGPPLATARDSAAAAVRDSIVADSLARAATPSSASGETIPRPRPRPRVTQPANDVNGVIPRPSTDSMPSRPITDTLRRDTSRIDSAFSRSPIMPRDTSIRDTVRPRPDTMAGRPSVRVETTYVRGTVRRDSIGRP